MKSSLTISVLIHAALVVALLLVGRAVIQERDVFFVELKSITVTPALKGAAAPAPAATPKAMPQKEAASRPEPKKEETKEPLREVKEPAVELKRPSVEVEKTAEPAVSHASYAVESPREEPAGVSDAGAVAYSVGEDVSEREVSKERGAGGESAGPSSGPEVSREALLLQIRDAIQRELTYPTLARRRKLEGTVVAGFVIDRGGQPHEIEIVQSSGFSILDKEVLEIIERASPYPHIAERVEVPVSFRLVTGR